MITAACDACRTEQHVTVQEHGGMTMRLCIDYRSCAQRSREQEN